MRHILISILLAFSTALCMSTASAEESLRIGVSVSMSGKYAEPALAILKGYKIWESDINKKGGVLGRKVQLIVYDDKSDPETARERYQHLILVDKVDLVFGPNSSELTEAIVAVTEKYGYPMIATGAGADALWQKGYKYIFGVYTPASKHNAVFLEALLGQGLNKLAIISANDVFSRNLAAGAKEWAKRFEMNVMFTDELKKETFSQDLEQTLRKAQASGAEVLMICGHFNESVSARLALKHIGWSPRAYYATVGPALVKYGDVLKADAEHTFSSAQWEPTAPFPGAREFAQSFQQIHNVLPSYQAAGGYATGQILEAAVRKTGSVDREKFRDALSSLDTTTIMGRYGVDHTGKQIRHSTFTVQWQNGKKEVIAPPEFMTAKAVWK
jgi:branched-chain amino acid transport system substrate-binding protein